MESKEIDGMVLRYEPEDREAAGLIGKACGRSAALLQAYWGLQVPDDCVIYVMTSWQDIFGVAPLSWKVLLGITYPLWGPRARRTWPFAGGWEQRMGKRCTVGIKPPRLMELSDGRMGERIFVPSAAVEEKVEFTACHELTHGFTSHLRLPSWLKEGVAMVAVDRFAGRPTVRGETLESVANPPAWAGARPDDRLRVGDPEAMVYIYVQGYWLTRYLDEAHPAVLKELLARRHRPDELEAKLAAACRLPPQGFWAQIDGVVVDHFGGG